MSPRPLKQYTTEEILKMPPYKVKRLKLGNLPPELKWIGKKLEEWTAEDVKNVVVSLIADVIMLAHFTGENRKELVTLLVRQTDIMEDLIDLRRGQKTEEAA